MGTQNNTNNKKKQHRGAKAYQYKYWEHPKNERVQKLPVSQLKPFEEQPFKVLISALLLRKSRPSVVRPSWRCVMRAWMNSWRVSRRAVFCHR